MPQVTFEPTIPASARSQTYALDRMATGLGCCEYSHYVILGYGTLLSNIEVPNLQIYLTGYAYPTQPVTHSNST
jgi:hypothetical protein